MSQSLQAKRSGNEHNFTTLFEAADGFQYQPLDTTKEEIRLVKLHRSTVNEHTHVFCDVHTFELAAAPLYVALSYTWGPPDPKRVIFIGGEPYEIRENLYAFLYAFRSEESNNEYIYIDQLCIDQDSPDERNHQVRLMSRIYTRCMFVIIWLDNTSTKAAADFEATLNPDSAELVLRNKYFTRLWIVQEVLLPPQVRVLCGNTWLSWSELGNLIWKMPDCYLSLHGAHDTASIAWLFSPPRQWWDKRNRLPLDRCVDLFACMKCEDPRDKVYGLLGLASRDEHPRIDYRKPVTEVFLDTITVLRNTHWKRRLEKGEIEDECGRRCASYYALGRHMGLCPLELKSLWSFVKGICDTEELVLSRSEDAPDRSPVVSLGFEQGVTSSCSSRWWYVYLEEKYEFLTECPRQPD